MAFMRKIKADIRLSAVEAHALCRADSISKQGGVTLAKALGGYLHTLYDGLLKRGDIEESYDDFESRWFCDYYGDPDGDGFDCMIDDLYKDMVCGLLGVGSLSDLEDSKATDALVKSTSDSEDCYVDGATGELVCDASDRRIAGALFERVNSDVEQSRK